mmetsp:Transcript_20204/g.44809  ORF Transcript_20204/g.44809 Transcript_20204/m.44809 type:complete len:91 (-) Transcript_20204:71-343(-)|eukprot:CAMPEP_0204276784 /NCGR_PEP_ID=MMETSP0468-20130131/28871_1 /ASSEMBLY_ACC=CAM_ASM_000383 /TAXON_ID=2969 /ORGANISM="Oxyrrhis marina" /LENGTH=90 /DNA_ID=CAMNT_0051253483 /DNA_START=24 /DNA_END=296 /DNA_ORIENTATION=+
MADETKILEGQTAQSRAYDDPVEGRAAELVAQRAQPVLTHHSLPMRQYMDEQIVPILLPALNAVAAERPADPVEWLAYYLLKNNPHTQAA